GAQPRPRPLGVTGMTATTGATRTERDSMGPMEVPAEAYYGASTMRAVLNFPISPYRFPRPFIRALGQIKLRRADQRRAWPGAGRDREGDRAGGAGSDRWPLG